MKKTLIAALALLAFAACTKEDPTPTATNNSTYPYVYEFEAANNASAIRNFVQTGEIMAAPNCLSSKDTALNSFFSEYLNGESHEYMGMKITLLSETHAQITQGGSTDDISVIVEGDYLNFANIYQFKKTSNSLILHRYLMVIKSEDSRYSENGDYSPKYPLPGEIQSQCSATDTAAVKTYDLVFKQK